MREEVNCVILWHKFSAEGTLVNASSTHLRGSMGNLNDRLREAHDKCATAQAEHKPYTIPVQVISSNALPEHH